MQINIKAVKSLIDEQYRGNQRWFAEELGVDEGYLGAILNGKRKSSSPKVIERITKLCKKNNLRVKDYIFLQ